MQSGRTMNGWLLAVICSLGLASCSHKQEPEIRHQLVPVVKKPITEPIVMEPMRGIWLATVSRLDWPPQASLQASSQTERIRLQKESLIKTLDELKESGINTLFFQVKPDGTALWHSAILPWSDMLTGIIGADPGYDPLAFVLQEAHRRGIKVHAWLNPYRVSMNTKPETVRALHATLSSSPASVFVLHPDWIRTASDRFVLDPGLPEVRDWITNVVTELVNNYDIDGVQFDDYFYYETPDSPLKDNATWRQYGSGFADKASWRRNNTLLLVKQISAAIKKLKPDIEFGISPAGVWRNKDEDPLGSATRGGTAYDTSYADTRQWVKLGLLDYIAPQLYWPVARKIVRYDVLAHWWADVVKNTDTKLYIGVALYKIGMPSAAEPDWTIAGGVPELKRQLDINDALPEVKGTILFRQGFLNQPQTAEAVHYLQNRWRPKK